MKKGGFQKFIRTNLDNYSIRKKLTIFFLFCVILPMFITDSIVLSIILREERAVQEHNMQNIASAVEYDLTHTLYEAVRKTNQLYINEDVNQILEYTYPSQMDYFGCYYNFIKGTFFEAIFNSDSVKALLYADNSTLINGGYISQIDLIRKEKWYEDFISSDRDMLLYYYYGDDRNLSALQQRKFVIIRRLNYFKNLPSDKIVKLELDYNTLVRQLSNMKYSNTVYVCSGDTIILSSQGKTGYTEEFETLTGGERIGYEKTLTAYGQTLRILIMDEGSNTLAKIKEEIPLIAFLLLCNIALPLIMMWVISHSFVSRLQRLSEAFDMVDIERLDIIDNIKGTDEIGSLMRNYNRMVEKSSELIKIVYKDKIENQEMDLAKQNAELLALHSQINPHFLYNVLESIRMHSLLKKENDTAEMIGRLALIERQYAEWTDDFVTIGEEMKLVRSYLELQKYRFGGRLLYEINVEEGCKAYRIPKLTIVTFVENSCVHGVEEKTSSTWIYVSIYEKEDKLCMEVEDTGNGMDDSQIGELLYKIEHCDIGSLKENKHIGILNACLRLKMMSQDAVRFELTSEKLVGTFMKMELPVSYLHGKRGIEKNG